jgi:hypothetical protein
VPILRTNHVKAQNIVVRVWGAAQSGLARAERAESSNLRHLIGWDASTFSVPRLSIVKGSLIMDSSPVQANSRSSSR